MKLGMLAGPEFKLAAEDAVIPVVGLTADSRQVKPGYVFFAMAGTVLDGAAFIPQAVETGAAGIVTHLHAKVDDLPVPVLRAADPRITLSRMASVFYARQPETMVAVTGTAGKTSVTSFVRQIWEAAGFAAASIGTTGIVAPGRVEYGNLTTPDPVALHALLDALAGGGVSHASMEASSHGLDQHRLDGVRLTAAGFTNLGRDHLDYHPTVAAYFEAKMRLFRDLLPRSAPAVVFADDEFSDRVIEVAKGAGVEVLTVGRKGGFLALKRLEHERFRQIVEVQYGDKLYRLEFPLAGDFQIANGLVAAGLAIASGVTPDVALGALENLKGAPGRLELVGRSHKAAPVYVDYAHKPEALENVLTSLRPFTSGKLVLVYGCGGDRDSGKRPIMGEIAERLADTAIVTDDNPRSEDAETIRAQILAENRSAVEIADRAEAIRRAVGLLGEGDCLVVAGKGHEEGQIVGDTVLPFSDKKMLQKILGANDP